MSNKISEKEKTEYNLNHNENKSFKQNNSLTKNRKMSNPKSFIKNNNCNIIKTRHLPHLKRNNLYYNYDNNKEKITPISYRRNYSNNNNLFDIKEKQKEKLIMEINQSNNELKNQDKEIKKFQNLYGTIKRENLTNQFLIYQILNKDKEKSKSIENNKTATEKEMLLDDNLNQKKEQISNKEKKMDKNSISFKDEKYSNSNIDTNSFFITGTNIYDKNNNNFSSNKTSNMKKNKTCIINSNKSKKDSSKLKLLKKELDYYIKTIDEDTKKLEKFKENDKITGYLQTKKELDEKNKELDDLITKSNGLQGDINDHDMVIYFYKLKNDNYISLINDIKRRINTKHKPIYTNWERRVKKLESQKEVLENQNKLYISEIDRIKEINETNKKRENELKEFLRKNEKYLDEKNKNSLEVTNSYNNEQRLKKKCDLNNKKIEKLRESNNALNELITKTEVERKNKLLEKQKNEQIQQEKMKKITEEINNINKEMQKTGFKSIIEQKNLENEINKSNELINEQKKEIESLILNEKNIINEINNLNKELDIISKESENQKNEMQLLIKNFEKINNKNNNKNNENDLKEENENLLKQYNQKKKELDEAYQKNNKLNDILKEIKKL